MTMLSCTALTRLGVCHPSIAPHSLFSTSFHNPLHKLKKIFYKPWELENSLICNIGCHQYSRLRFAEYWRQYSEVFTEEFASYEKESKSLSEIAELHLLIVFILLTNIGELTVKHSTGSQGFLIIMVPNSRFSFCLFVVAVCDCQMNVPLHFLSTLPYLLLFFAI